MYQRVVAPCDGVITQRNVDIGRLGKPDATSGTSCSRSCRAKRIQNQVGRAPDQGRIAAGLDALVRVHRNPDSHPSRQGDRGSPGLQPGSAPLTETIIRIPTETLSPGIYCPIEIHCRARHQASRWQRMRSFNEAGLKVAVVEKTAWCTAQGRGDTRATGQRSRVKQMPRQATETR